MFCGMGINNTHMYEKAVRAMARQRVALEILSYHSSATFDEVQRLKVSIGLNLRVNRIQILMNFFVTWTFIIWHDL